MDWNAILNTIVEWGTTTGVKIIISILILLITFKIINVVSRRIEKAKQIIKDICLAHELVLKEKEPFVRVKEHGDSSINITTRVWANTKDYWMVYYDITEQVKTAFDKEGIEIPFNQLDVRIKKED